MLSVLATGTLVRDPQERMSAAGKPFVTALMRVPVQDGDAMLASIIGFRAEVVRTLMALSKGDGVSIAGQAKLSEWESKDGEAKRGLNIVADQALSVYQIEKRRRQSREEPAAA